MPETLAERIHRLRLLRGMPARTFGARLGVSAQAVYR